MNNDSVCKEWKGFGFKRISKDDYPAVISHLEQNFLKDEPLHQILGVTEDRLKDVAEKITDILDLAHGSFYAFPLEDPTKVHVTLTSKQMCLGKESN